MSYRQLLVRKTLEGEQVRNFMRSDLISVPSVISVKELVDDYFYKYHFQMFPVLDNGLLIGCVTTQQVKETPKEQWAQRTVRELAKPCSEENTISSQADAVQALTIMNRTGSSRLLVVDGGQLVGIITLKDMLKFFAIKIDLEGE
jgi:predicted transcriptional regulator